MAIRCAVCLWVVGCLFLIGVEAVYGWEAGKEERLFPRPQEEGLIEVEDAFPTRPLLPRGSGRGRESRPEEGSFRGEFEVGAGYSPSEGMLFRAKILAPRFFVEGLSLHLSTLLSSQRVETELGARLALPSMGPFYLGLFANVQQRTWEAWSEGIKETRVLGRLVGGLRLSQGFRLEASYIGGWEDQERMSFVLDRTPLIAPRGGWSSQGRLGGLRLALIGGDPEAERLWLPLGFRFQATFDGSDPALGSRYSYLRGDVDLGYGMSLPHGLHLRLGAKGGIAWSPHGALPFSERYQLGGGVGMNRHLPAVIGPAVWAGDHAISLGGEGAFWGEIALTIPLVPKIGLFFEATLEGGALLHPSLPTPTLPGRPGVGMTSILFPNISLAWRSPIGLLRLGLGSIVEFRTLAGLPAFPVGIIVSLGGR